MSGKPMPLGSTTGHRDLSGTLRVCSLNLRAYPSPVAEQITRLAALLTMLVADLRLATPSGSAS